MASITDYLKSKGFQDSGTVAPFFDTKKKAYETLGLNSSLGGFSGTAEQNTALLNELTRRESSSGIALNPSNIFTIISGTSNNTTPNYTPVGGEGSRATVNGVTSEWRNGTWMPVQTSVTQPPTTKQPTNTIYEAPTSASQSQTTYGGTPTVTPTPTQEETTSGEYEIPSYLRNLVSQAYQPTPSASDLAKQAVELYSSRATYPLEQEKLAADKAATELNAQREKENFITDIASRGLIFSGKKTEGLKTIEADKLSKLLGIDRNYAILVAQGLESASQQIAKEAQKGNEDAISTLDKLGYILVDGTLVRKPSEVRADEAAARSAASEERAIASAERADIRLGLSLESATRAEEAANRAAETYKQNQLGIYKISSSKINNYVKAGVPVPVANDIYQSLQLGMTLEEIRQGLASLYGRDIGYAYLDKFMPVFERDEGYSLADYLNE
jgi:hypothetical protein